MPVSRIDNPRVAPSVTPGRVASSGARQGVFGARKASRVPTGVAAERVGNILKPPQAASNGARAVSPAAQGNFSLGELNRFGNYLANNAERGLIAKELLPDFTDALTFAGRLDKDILRASELLEKSDRMPLTPAEQTEANALMAACKHNLTLVQGWLSAKRAQLQDAGKLTEATQTFMQNLQERLADRHMDTANLMSLYDLDLTTIEDHDVVSRNDRIDANLVSVSAALDVARNLSAPGLSDTAKQNMIDVLEDQHAQLVQAKNLAGDRVAASRLQPGGKLSLAAKEIWETPFSLIKDAKGDADSIRQLRAHWDAKAERETPDRWLPLAHPKIGQQRLLTEFLAHQLAAAGVSKEAMPDLKFQFKQARNRALNEQPWTPISKEIRYNLDKKSDLTLDGRADLMEGSSTLSARSDITPARQIARYFPEDYSANGVNCSDRTQYKHAPNLAHTQLVNEQGQVIFSGLRHGVLDAYDISPGNLKKMSDDELLTMFCDMLRSANQEDRYNPDTNSHYEAAARLLIDDIRGKDPARASAVAKDLRAFASRNMAEEVAVAALATDPEKFQRALDGETVNIDLSSLSLLTPDRLRSGSHSERRMLENQTAALQALAAGKQPVTLNLRDEDGNLRAVQANIKVRTFNFGVNGGAVGSVFNIPSTAPGWKQLMGWGYAMQQNDPELTRLLGDGSAAELGGDVQDKLDKLRAERGRLQAGLRRLSGAELDEAADRLQQLEKQHDNLELAADDVKNIWRNGSFVSGGQDPYKMVSRLTLIGQLMDETPLFNCKSGKDRTGQLDAEVKFLAALGDKSMLPRPEENEHRVMRSAFTLDSGNLEMQKLNTGLPGYKLNWKEVPGLASMLADQSLESAYRGGSDYVKS